MAKIKSVNGTFYNSKALVALHRHYGKSCTVQYISNESVRLNWRRVPHVGLYNASDVEQWLTNKGYKLINTVDTKENNLVFKDTVWCFKDSSKVYQIRAYSGTFCTRPELTNFIRQTKGVSVSRQYLFQECKKYNWNRIPGMGVYDEKAIFDWLKKRGHTLKERPVLTWENSLMFKTTEWS